MTTIALLGSKGGAGASLLATNLGVALARGSSAVLVDLHLGLGYDDLLLDLSPRRSWVDLLPVARELTERHLAIALERHSSGLQLLGAPAQWAVEVDPAGLATLVAGLAERFDWVLLDAPNGAQVPFGEAVRGADCALLITTPDLPALRNARRTVQGFPRDLRPRTQLVLNQIGRGHPAEPERIAQALDLSLLAALPTDLDAVAAQIGFGKPCVGDPGSSFGRAVGQIAAALEGMAGELGQA
jgi:Flp pilus assembly CpaE family ATPase